VGFMIGAIAEVALKLSATQRFPVSPPGSVSVEDLTIWSSAAATRISFGIPTPSHKSPVWSPFPKSKLTPSSRCRLARPPPPRSSPNVHDLPQSVLLSARQRHAPTASFAPRHPAPTASFAPRRCRGHRLSLLLDTAGAAACPYLSRCERN
jgi:hypothetical protein